MLKSLFKRMKKDKHFLASTISPPIVACMCVFCLFDFITVVLSTPLNTPWPPNPQLVPTPLRLEFTGIWMKLAISYLS